eukprot:6214021-Pleurochrysis_carterae.AAC.3
MCNCIYGGSFIHGLAYKLCTRIVQVVYSSTLSVKSSQAERRDFDPGTTPEEEGETLNFTVHGV